MKNENITYHIEYTDTFNGEANYAWVRRYTITVPESLPQKTVCRIAKELVDIAGSKGNWEEMGDMLQFTPLNSCTVLFITWE